MKTIEFEAFEVVSTDGYTDRHEGYCSSHSLAHKLLVFKKLGAYGRVVSPPVKKKFVIFETEEDFIDYNRQKLVDSAISKLTKGELEALLSSFQST